MHSVEMPLQIAIYYYLFYYYYYLLVAVIVVEKKIALCTIVSTHLHVNNSYLQYNVLVFFCRSAKEAEDNIRRALEKGQVLPKEERFDSNCITPGKTCTFYILLYHYFL
jgi:hypothetical protein